MPSLRHEALVDLFRTRPELAAELLASVSALDSAEGLHGAPLDSDLSQLTPSEYRADAVVKLEGPRDIVVVAEVQLRRDDDKPWVWPVYLTTLRARERCEVALLVITLSRATARWAAQPIQLGNGAVLTPYVIGPEQVPKVTDAEQAAKNPEVAVLSAMAHGREPEAVEIGFAAVQATKPLDPARARLYIDLVCRALNPAARAALEQLMIQNWEPQSEFLRRLDREAQVRGFNLGQESGLEQGLEQGQRALLRRQLTRRFGDIPAWVEARIDGAGGPQLMTWAEELLDAASIEALFGGPPPA